jgi:hypothetical protein
MLLTTADAYLLVTTADAYLLARNQILETRQP